MPEGSPWPADATVPWIASVDPVRARTLRRSALTDIAPRNRQLGLMAMAGWTRVEMLIRYTLANAGERAASEARRLDLGRL